MGAANYSLGWIKIPDREHWLVRSPHGVIVGEVFQTHPGHRYFGLAYDITFHTLSGCIESYALRDIETAFLNMFMNKVLV